MFLCDSNNACENKNFVSVKQLFLQLYFNNYERNLQFDDLHKAQFI